MSGGLFVARRYFEGRNYAKCLDALGQAGDGALEENDFWFLRAESLRRLRRFDEAVAAAKAGLAREPEDIGLLDSLGLSFVSLGEVAGGDEAFRAGLSLVPDHPVLLAHHAVALAKLGSVDDARHVVSMLTNVAPDSPVTLEARAQVSVITKDAAADRHVADLLALDPESRLGQGLRGQLAYGRKQARVAAEAFGQAAALDPENLSLAKAARVSRLAANPLLAPSRRIFMLGRKRARLVYLVVIVPLILAHQYLLEFIFFGFWIIFMVIVPRTLGVYYRRRYGRL